MATPTAIAAYIALFALTGFLFLFANLVLGWLVRPRLPNQEKLEVYECGEPTIGSSFVQFDLRFYVVALLFIIFDVEVAFFFPWAAVYGKATQLSAETIPLVASDLDPELTGPQAAQLSSVAARQLSELGIRNPAAVDPAVGEGAAAAVSDASIREAATRLARTSLADIAVFFGVLLVGFAYVWKRGDLDWVRAIAQPRRQPMYRAPPIRALEPSQSILSA